MKKLVVPFSKVGMKDIALVGGKNASLGEMLSKTSVPVPDGYAITANAYKYFIQKAKIRPKIKKILKHTDVKNIKQLQKAGHEIRELIQNAEMPKDLQRQIMRYFRKLDSKFVAIRSSATAEDLPSVSEDEYVFVKFNGKPFFGKIKDLFNKYKPNDGIEVLSMNNFNVEWRKASDIYKHIANNKNLYRITTSTGRKIVVSPNHSLIVLNEDTLQPKVVEMSDLKGGEKIPVVKNIPPLDSINEIDVLEYIPNDDVVEINGKIMVKNNSGNWTIQNGLPRKISITADFAYFLGIYVAEGTTYKNNNVIITNSNKKIIDKIRNFISLLGINSTNKINKNSFRIYCKPLVRFLNENCGPPNEKIKGKGKTCYTKQVPPFIFACSADAIGEFLRGCFDGDGTVSKNVSYSSTSEKLISGISTLLAILGVEFYVKKKKTSFELSIPLRSMEKFRDRAGFTHEGKLNKLNDLIEKYNKSDIHFEFKNSMKISDSIVSHIRHQLENELPKRNFIDSFCPICSNNIGKTSKYRNKQRYFCCDCKKTFYENNVVKRQVEKYVNYSENGRFVKGSIPWNKSVNTYPNYGITRFKEVLNNNGLVRLSEIFSDDITWDTIVNVEKVPYDSAVYDFTVPDVENFASGIGNIITHNSASFAGEQESYLNVEEHHLIQRVKDCFASLFTDRAISYREDKKFDHFRVFLSVAVQKLIFSKASGVMFTLDPDSGHRGFIYINGSYGLGDYIVQGRVNPDDFIVLKPTMTIIQKKLGRKDQMEVRSHYGVHGRAVPAAMRKRFVLTDKEILQLAKYGMEIEKHYGRPMDIEWAKDGKQMYIIQARPETVHSSKKKNIYEDFKLLGKGKTLVSGTAIGRKIGAGTVNVIRSVKDINKFKKGEILVTVMTNPDWEPIMKIASAIVTEVGGKTCFAEDTVVLTNKGFIKMVDLYKRVKDGEEFKIYSYNHEKLKPEWKNILSSQKNKLSAIRIQTSQTGNMEGNYIDLTPSHKTYTFENRNLIKKPIKDILKKEEMVCVPDYLPPIMEQSNEKLAYHLGALVTDGNIFLQKGKKKQFRRGFITFTQKDTEEKREFIDTVNQYFLEIFDKEMRAKTKFSSSMIRGRLIEGEATDHVCYDLDISLELTRIISELPSFAMSLDERSSFNLLAGILDGDGSFHDNRLQIYASKENVLQVVVISCLKLGIFPQITKNRNIYNVQILERIDDLLKYTKRIKGETREKILGTKLYSARQLLGDVVDEVNFKGQIKPYVKNNLLIDARKVCERILPLTKGDLKRQLLGVLDSSLRMHRVGFVEDLGRIDVYNIEVDAENELDHNFVVFTKRYTPILVSNSHAAIVSRELGVPCIVAALGATTKLRSGKKVTVDCTEEDGKVLDGMIKFKVDQHEITKIPKTKTQLMVNLGEPEQAFDIAQLPVDGVGLAREEFIIATHIGEHPLAMIEQKRQKIYIDKLAEGIGKIGAAFYPRPVIVRLSDFKTNEYGNLKGGKKFEPPEDNPMIGWRGASRYVDKRFEPAFRLECKAFKKVIEEMKLTNVKIMVPFCRTLAEADGVIAIMKSEGLMRGRNGLQLYVMAEIPSNIILVKEFSKRFDGFSIGSNDLTQLTLGIDRDNHMLAKEFDERNAAIKISIERLIKGAHESKRKVGICGDAPSTYPEYAEFLVKAGIDSISVTPDVAIQTKMNIAKAEGSKRK
jgi:pyruvate,water dikinase